MKLDKDSRWKTWRYSNRVRTDEANLSSPGDEQYGVSGFLFLLATSAWPRSWLRILLYQLFASQLLNVTEDKRDVHDFTKWRRRSSSAERFSIGFDSKDSSALQGTARPQGFDMPCVVLWGPSDASGSARPYGGLVALSNFQGAVDKF